MFVSCFGVFWRRRSQSTTLEKAFQISQLTLHEEPMVTSSVQARLCEPRSGVPAPKHSINSASPGDGKEIKRNCRGRLDFPERRWREGDFVTATQEPAEFLPKSSSITSTPNNSGPNNSGVYSPAWRLAPPATRLVVRPR
jgi:hypothetical protein